MKTSGEVHVFGYCTGEQLKGESLDGLSAVVLPRAPHESGEFEEA